MPTSISLSLILDASRCRLSRSRLPRCRLPRCQPPLPASSVLCQPCQPRCQLSPRPVSVPPTRPTASTSICQRDLASGRASRHTGTAPPMVARPPCMPSHTNSARGASTRRLAPRLTPLCATAPHTHLEGRRPCCSLTVRRTQKSCARGAARPRRSLPTASLASLANFGSLASLTPLAGATLKPVLR